MGRLFGTDGIRGRTNEYPMTAEMALAIGRAAAQVFKREGHTPKILIGKDTRLSGYMFEGALVAGICSAGVNAIVVGVIPTPGIAYLTSSMRADAGIVISASHNPIQDSGIKIFSGEGFKLPDEKELEIERIVLDDAEGKAGLSPYELGKAFRMEDARGRYIVFLKHTFPCEFLLEGRRFVLDCANGATYRVAPETFMELGAEVIPLFHEPDGRNINVDCGSQYPEKLAEAVVRNQADAGFAFDGDGDRLIAVDETGTVLTGDQIIALCARVLKQEGRLSGNMVVRTVMSNVGLTVALRELGIDSVMAGVGDRFVLEEMVARGAVLGGEDSGHIIFREFHTTGDGIITALQVAAAMVKEGKPLSELAKIMTVYPQHLINLDVRSKPDLSSIPEVVAIIETVEKKLGDRGRVLVRYSGTQNMCRVMVEGQTRAETESCCRLIADVIRAEIG